MIAEAGLAALWFAGALAALQLVMAAIGIRRGRDDVAAAVRPVSRVWRRTEVSGGHRREASELSS